MTIVRRIAAPLALLAAAACTRAGEPAPSGAPGPATAAGAPAAHAPADVAFLHGMVAHHRQALEMTALVPDRSRREAVHRLAGRIHATQVTEIDQMERWLRTRNLPAAAGAAHTGHLHMPGMLTPGEFAELRNAAGDRFDRRFLELMIRHHEGALVMVAELFATDSAGQEPELFRLAADVDADQRAEIARMRRLLTTITQDAP